MYFLLVFFSQMFWVDSLDSCILLFIFPIFCGHTCSTWKFPRPGTESEPPLQPTPQLQQCWILNPVHLAGDRTWAFAVTQAAAVGFFFPFFLGLHPRHTEVLRLGDKLEPQLLATATARATRARDQTHILLDTPQWELPSVGFLKLRAIARTPRPRHFESSLFNEHPCP